VNFFWQTGAKLHQKFASEEYFAADSKNFRQN
jgi:hypothetical protein